MATRRELLILAALVVIILILVKVMEVSETVMEADASKFVTEDLYAKYPGSDIEILAVKEKQNDAGEQYYEVKAKVTKDYNTPCPTRMHIYYNYPVQNFVPQPTEYITRNCEVCTEGTCTMAFPEEAVIASHTLRGTSDVARFIKDFETPYPMVTEEDDSWLVVWDSPVSTYYYSVTVDKNGRIVTIERTEKV